jgi:hypothetical protein
MKSLSLLLTLSLAALTASAQSYIPTYKSFAATNTTTTAVIVPHQATSQARVVSVIASSDLASSSVTFYSGSTARYVAYANTNTASPYLYLDSTNGLTATNVLLYVAGASSNIVGTIAAIATTNVVVSGITNTYGQVTLTANVGFATPLNTEVELLATGATLGLGATTNKFYGSEALYVGNYGRALYITTTGTAACRLDSVTVHYDGASQ